MDTADWSNRRVRGAYSATRGGAAQLRRPRNAEEKREQDCSGDPGFALSSVEWVAAHRSLGGQAEWRVR